MYSKSIRISALLLAVCLGFSGCASGSSGSSSVLPAESPVSEAQVKDPDRYIGARNLMDDEEATSSETAESVKEAKAREALSGIDRSTLPAIDISSWQYMLVNADNPCGEYAPETSEFEGEQLDSRIIDAMTDFVADARAAGVKVYISSGYRDYDTQTYLFNRKIKQGYSEAEAATIVAPPGTSEHQTGLACDITDVYRKTKNSSLENTDTYKWMSAHCQEYGFIVRFPDGKEDITGIIYEPWHYRYVGIEAATFIMEHGLCLEEFLSLYQ